MKEFYAYVDENAERFVAELQRLCRQPSIAAQGVGVMETAEMVLEMLRGIGAEARLIAVDDAPPVVYGTIGQGQKSLLFYNHYDVQPPDPLGEWVSDPFAAEIREGVLYARGVADNKGNLVARLKAIEAYRATQAELPLKVIFAFEGEEEVGSTHLPQFVEENRELLKADGCIWEGAAKDPAGRQVLYLGLKGVLYLELRAKAASRDLHSSWATVVPNPAWHLVWALSTLKDENDRITVDGLMERVAEPSPEELELLRRLPFEEEKIKEEFGIGKFIRDLHGLEALKKHLYEPTCNICGIKSGYVEEGLKTVLPHQAMVKLDFRLVPNLEPEMVLDLVRKHLKRRGFGDIEVTLLAGENWAKSPLDAPIVKAAKEATRRVYGQEPVIWPLMAGSGPMYLFARTLGIPVASGAGVGHEGSNIHAPNENVEVNDYLQAIKYYGELIERFAEGR